MRLASLVRLAVLQTGIQKDKTTNIWASCSTQKPKKKQQGQQKLQTTVLSTRHVLNVVHGTTIAINAGDNKTSPRATTMGANTTCLHISHRIERGWFLHRQTHKTQTDTMCQEKERGTNEPTNSTHKPNKAQYQTRHTTANRHIRPA